MSSVVRMHGPGDPDVLVVETETVGQPGRGQVRLRQEAIGVNFVDTYFRSGRFPLPGPAVIGVEGVGVVDAVGPDVSDIAVGDRMGYYLSLGAYRESRLISAAELIPIPSDVSSTVAASILAKGLTAWGRLFRVHPVTSDTRVVVTGATGGVGSLLAPWAADLGAEVIALVARPDSVSRLRALGVQQVAVAGTGELEAIVEKAGGKVDVAFDQVGAAVADELLGVLGTGSQLDLLGSASGEIDPALLDAAQRRGVRITRSSAGDHIPNRKVLLQAAEDLFGALRKGTFGERAIREYPLAEAARAHHDMEQRTAGPAPVLIP